jgi:hypothetical protein
MKPGPGKFEGCEDLETAERLYAITLDGGCDEEDGSVDEGGWIGLIGEAIVTEDSQGFFTYTLFDSEAAARHVWASLLSEVRFG